MFYSITPGAAIAALIAVFWVLSICSSEDEQEEKKADPEPAKEPGPYTEGWQDESVHWYVDRYGRLLDENGGVFINPLL
jgi:hypothetical protein